KNISISFSLVAAMLALQAGGVFVTIPHVQAAFEPYQQTFVTTAYYSPLPNQSYYVTGSYHWDKVLNGNGTHGASGTPVFEGMIAAPSSYAFGTQVSCGDFISGT